MRKTRNLIAEVVFGVFFGLLTAAGEVHGSCPHGYVQHADWASNNLCVECETGKFNNENGEEMCFDCYQEQAFAIDNCMPRTIILESNADRIITPLPNTDLYYGSFEACANNFIHNECRMFYRPYAQGIHLELNTAQTINKIAIGFKDQARECGAGGTDGATWNTVDAKPKMPNYVYYSDSAIDFTGITGSGVFAHIQNNAQLLRAFTFAELTDHNEGVRSPWATGNKNALLTFSFPTITTRHLYVLSWDESTENGFCTSRITLYEECLETKCVKSETTDIHSCLNLCKAPPGYGADATGDNIAPCEQNTYNNGTFANCQACPENFLAAVGSTSQADCIEECQPGSYVHSSNGNKKCLFCPPGEFSETIDSEACTPCAPGMHSYRGETSCFEKTAFLQDTGCDCPEDAAQD